MPTARPRDRLAQLAESTVTGHWAYTLMMPEAQRQCVVTQLSSATQRVTIVANWLTPLVAWLLRGLDPREEDDLAALEEPMQLHCCQTAAHWSGDADYALAIVISQATRTRLQGRSTAALATLFADQVLTGLRNKVPVITLVQAPVFTEPPPEMLFQWHGFRGAEILYRAGLGQGVASCGMQVIQWACGCQFSMVPDDIQWCGVHGYIKRWVYLHKQAQVRFTNGLSADIRDCAIAMWRLIDDMLSRAITNRGRKELTLDLLLTFIDYPPPQEMVTTLLPLSINMRTGWHIGDEWPAIRRALDQWMRERGPIQFPVWTRRATART